MSRRRQPRARARETVERAISAAVTRRSAIRDRWLLGVLVLVALSAGCARETERVLPEEPRAPVEVRADVDRAVATTGDLIDFRITVDYELAYELEIPEAGAEIAGFRIVDVGQEQVRGKRGRIVDQRWYQLRADLVGSYVLPPLQINFRERAADGQPAGEWESLSTSEIFVEVESVLPADGEAQDIRGLKPLRSIRRRTPWPWIVAGLVGAGLLAGLAWLLVRRRARRARELPPIPAHELAFQALDALRRTDFDDPEAVRRFYFRISGAIRAYVEGRFGLNATDLTTEEIVSGLSALSELGPDDDAALRRFLMDTDQVKFAHHEPSRDEIEGAYERAVSFVEATHPSMEAPEEEAVAA